MNQLNAFVLLSSLLQPGLAGYALHLNRLFGSRSVGWWVFSAFLCLGLLHLVHLLQPAAEPPAVIDVVICVLLLVGMAHTQSFLAGRARLERQREQFGLELGRVTREAAELGTSNKHLLQQLLAREQREQALKTAEEQWCRIFSQNPEPMWVFELTSLRLLSANGAALRIYGYSASEWGAHTARELYAAEEVPAFLQACAQPAPHVPTARLCRHRRKDGSCFEVEVMALDLLFEGRPARLMVAHDVSLWRQNELELLASQELLNLELQNLKSYVQDVRRIRGG